MNIRLKSYGLIFILFVLTCTLSACAPMYSSDYTYQPPKSWNGKQCVNQCLQNKSTCQMQCSTQNQQCVNSARLAALPAYIAYSKDPNAQAASPNKKLEDFADLSNCHQNCGCEETYNQCFTNCGGVITEHRQCTAFCDKVPLDQRQQTIRH